MAAKSSDSVDFIVVGAGTAGCLLAYRLAQALKTPSVLLLEAGPDNSAGTLRIPQERYTAVATNGINYGYESTPQEAVDGRVIPYPRGKGLGGSSNINFMAYIESPRVDYNRWAELVGDEAFGWKQTKERFKRIENLHDETAPEWKKYVDWKPENHGHGGPIDVSHPKQREKDVWHVMEAAEEAGYPINKDYNSGCIMGFSVAGNSSDNSFRTTSASGTLTRKPDNLEVRVNAPVTRVLFDKDKTAIGVQLADGSDVRASKEILLCGGSIDTPKLLLLSGIGPAQELAPLGINTVHDLPGVGKELKDHYGTYVLSQMDGELSDRAQFEKSTADKRPPRDDWLEDTTEYYTGHYNSLAWGFLRDEEILKTKEFAALDSSQQEFLRKPEVPLYELALALQCLLSFVFVMNSQSSGSVTLRSSDPRDAPLIHLGYCEHPYDRMVLVRAVREAMKFSTTSKLGRMWQKYVSAPKSDREEDILAHIRQTCMPVFHASGSVVMGRPDDAAACVDTDFRVYGTKRLRVADLSVCPLMLNGHTQAGAYQIGETAAEKIIAEYNLEQHRKADSSMMVKSRI
ncbi:hypothetical protein VTN00DRAFT_9124 [Thermoascus crustaceus]|uniref:uncharacterized protein n=1 Tax=Thermoascus crustaceus TaxID=5088 RepID=UPI00374200E0